MAIIFCSCSYVLALTFLSPQRLDLNVKERKRERERERERERDREREREVGGGGGREISVLHYFYRHLNIALGIPRVKSRFDFVFNLHQIFFKRLNLDRFVLRSVENKVSKIAN